MAAETIAGCSHDLCTSLVVFLGLMVDDSIKSMRNFPAKSFSHRRIIYIYMYSFFLPP